jgi:hypothetical protein
MKRGNKKSYVVIAGDANIISECCEAPAIFELVEGDYGWYVCSKCLQPCELIVQAENENL